MDDKDFPELFTKLGFRDKEIVKDSTNNIVKKLTLVPTDVSIVGIREKYSNEDLGKLTPDVNYTIKRLIKGMNSENHAVKKGFFLALASVLKTFKP